MTDAKKKKNHILSLQSHNLFYIPIIRFPLSLARAVSSSARRVIFQRQMHPGVTLNGFYKRLLRHGWSASIYSALQWFLQKNAWSFKKGMKIIEDAQTYQFLIHFANVMTLHKK